MSLEKYLFIYLGVPVTLSVLVGIFFEGDINDKIGAVLLTIFGSSILIMLLSALKTIGNFLKIKETKYAVKKRKKLPIYYSKFFKIVLIYIFLSFLSRELLNFPYAQPINYTLAYVQIIVYILISIICFIIVLKADEGIGSVLIAENIFNNKYGNTNVIDSSKDTAQMDKSPILRSLYSIYFQNNVHTVGTSFKGIHSNYIQFNYNSNIATVGSTNVKFFQRRTVNSSSNISIKNISYIELEQDITFKEKVLICKNITIKEILTESNIPTKYKNLGRIFYENSKDYAENLLSENVQFLIAELREHFKNIAVLFSGNTITVAINNARWSTWFSRKFNPNKNAENILKTTEIVLEYLTKIAEEIEKEGNY